jgi:hypothetical protein
VGFSLVANRLDLRHFSFGYGSLPWPRPNRTGRRPLRHDGDTKAGVDAPARTVTNLAPSRVPGRRTSKGTSYGRENVAGKRRG